MTPGTYTLAEALVLPLTWFLVCPDGGYDLILPCDRIGCDGTAAVLHPGCALCLDCHDELNHHPQPESKLALDTATIAERQKAWRHEVLRAYDNGHPVPRTAHLDQRLARYVRAELKRLKLEVAR